MTHLNQPATTADEHIETLRDLAEEYQDAAKQIRNPDSALRQMCERRGAAIRWLLEQNAYGVHESEVTV